MATKNRNKYMSAGIDARLMELSQMGAKVDVLSTKTCYIKLYIEDYKISYLYNVNKKGNYFLTRISPYQMPIAEFEDENELIKLIKIDIEQFTNAIKSHNMEAYIELCKFAIENIEMLEDLFLYYNVDKSELEEIRELSGRVRERIIAASRKDERVYDKKEPFHLKNPN